MNLKLPATQLADIAQEAALNVGPYLLNAFANPGPVSYKQDFHDIVTVHDKEAEHRIREILFAAVPGSVILGEEEGRVIDAAGAPAAPDNTVMWLVDPIDGTSNFASGLPMWCISIAAVQDGDVVAGVVYQPTAELLWRADDAGATLNGEPIQVATTMPVRESIIVVDFPYDRVDDYAGSCAGYQKMLSAAKSMRRHGSTALNLAQTAQGLYVGTMGMGTKPWDIGAGIALVRAAGGKFVAVTDDRERTEDRAFAHATYYACANDEAAALFNSVIDAVTPQQLTHNYFGW
ncbi:MAG: inositol monophosphatase family protein [Trueperella sp.]|nr:inositol monophosphatase family protein [Trueperella sp.]